MNARLSEIAITQPQAAYAAYTHGFKSKWTYLAWTTPNIETLLAPLEEVIRHKFLPAITGQNVFDGNLRSLIGLPARHGGLGITHPSQNSSTYYEDSKSIATPIVNPCHNRSIERMPSTDERGPNLCKKSISQFTKTARESPGKPDS